MTSFEFQQGALQDRHLLPAVSCGVKDMAERRRIEANIAAQSANPDSKLVAQERMFADELVAMAADAQRKALQAEVQTPARRGAAMKVVHESPKWRESHVTTRMV
jgi:hypothetical protein